MSDLTYLKQGLFTVFFPESKEGECAWLQIAEVTNGTGKVLTLESKSVIAQLRKAGYKVSKAKVPSISIDDMILELENF